MDQWKTAEAVTRAMKVGVIHRQKTIGSEMVWLFSLLFASRLKICSWPLAVVFVVKEWREGVELAGQGQGTGREGRAFLLLLSCVDQRAGRQAGRR